MLDAYRHFAGKRCAKCCRVRISPKVDLQLREGRAHFHGLMRCGLVWECPVCQLAIKTGRAEEVKTAVGWHVERYGRDGAAMLTLTVRHALGDDIRALRKGVANAWRRVQAGKAWLELREAVGVVGSIRALEITYGANGWHPHLHVVFLTKKPLTGGDWFLRWVGRRWARAVEAELGAAAVPSRERGADLRTLEAADYLQKLGLEISPADKVARGKGRTPLQILESFAETGDVADLEIWQAYVSGMKGARMLTWSRGLRVESGVDDRTDQDIVDGEAAAEIHVVTIRGEAWDELRNVPGMTVRLLEVAESSPPDVVREWIGQLTLWPPGYDPCEEET